LNTLHFEKELAQKYEYYPLSFKLSREVQKFYLENIPSKLKVTGDNISLFTTKNSLICTGYNRIVIGDYGAFIEYDENQANKQVYCIQPGEEYRIYDPKYSKNVKYIWFTIKDKSNIKIYYQKKKVSYADYKKGMYYISPHEIQI
jgi:hypothetical protein